MASMIIALERRKLFAVALLALAMCTIRIILRPSMNSDFGQWDGQQQNFYDRIF